MAKILLPLADGFEDIEAVCIIDVLRRGGVEVVSASMGSSLDVVSAHGVKLQADAFFSAVVDNNYDAIVLPGGGPGTEKLRSSEVLLRRLVKQREDGGLVCAICAAPLVLSDAGIFNRSHFATCYPTCQMEIDCEWVNQPVVEHDGIITGQGPGSAALFALVLLKTLVSETVARKVARGMLVDF